MKFLQPTYFLIALIVLLIHAYLLFRNTKTPSTDRYRKVHRIRRILILISRSVIIILLGIALAQPVSETSIFSDADSIIEVFIDESLSMEVLDQNQQETFLEELESYTPIQTRIITDPLNSDLATAIVNELSPNANVLVITDGQSSTQSEIGSVTRYATGLNASISFLELPTIQEDTAVRIRAPAKAVAQNPITIDVLISSTHSNPTPTKVSLDGKTILDEDLTAPGTQLQLELDEGDHVLEARIESEDYLMENNVYYTVIHVRKQPKLFVLTDRQDPVDALLDALYDTTYQTRLPDNLDPYAALVINNQPANVIDESKIATFLLEGNGAVFLGGQKSFDQGGYRNSALENILPVTVGKGERQEGNANIVVALDMSSSTENQGTQSLEKGLAISILQELNPTNKVGVLAFTYPQPVSPNGCTGACVIAPVQRLAGVRAELIEKVSRVDLTGNTALWAGLQGSLQLLENVPGSKNIILITDGQTLEDRNRLLTLTERLRQLGGKLYIVQVGQSTQSEALLTELAQTGGGALFRASQTNKLSVLFGEPVDPNEPDAFDLTVIDEHHFITRSLDPQATLFSRNQVAPKPASQQLVTLTSGDPILTIWYYGLGRVATITGYEGLTLGPLLREANSELITRSINWAIGDPDRLADTSITIADTYENETIRINVTANQPPRADNITFERSGTNRYEAILPPQPIGVHQAIGVKYAVNYPKEFQRVGVSSQLATVAAQTNGQVFSPNQAREAAQYIKTLRQQKETQLHDLDWIFISVAIFLLLIEVATRQWIRRRTKQ